VVAVRRAAAAGSLLLRAPLACADGSSSAGYDRDEELRLRPATHPSRFAHSQGDASMITHSTWLTLLSVLLAYAGVRLISL